MENNRKEIPEEPLGKAAGGWAADTVIKHVRFTCPCCNMPHVFAYLWTESTGRGECNGIPCPCDLGEIIEISFLSMALLLPSGEYVRVKLEDI